MGRSLDFELSNVALERFICDQNELAEFWRPISMVACEETYFWANLAQIILDKYNNCGNPVELILDIMDIDDEFYSDLIMQYLFDEGLVDEILELTDQNGQNLFE